MRDAGGELRSVDDVAAIGRQRDVALRLVVRRARLGELAGHAAHLHHRQGRAEGQHDGHLQQHAERVADDVGGEIRKTLGAVAALQHERLALGGERQVRLQPPRLAGEHQRRVLGDPRLHRGELFRVRIGGDLTDRAVAPGIGGPGAGSDGGGHGGSPWAPLSRDFAVWLHEERLPGMDIGRRVPVRSAQTTRHGSAITPNRAGQLCLANCA